MWDDRLLSPARALELSGAWPLTATYELAELSQFENEGTTERLEDQWQINLRCSTIRGWKYDATPDANAALDRVPCGQSVGLVAKAGSRFTISVNEIMAGVTRHQVMAHNLSLSATGPPRGDG